MSTLMVFVFCQKLLVDESRRNFNEGSARFVFTNGDRERGPRYEGDYFEVTDRDLV
jgi:hypothetical protein